MTTRSTIPAFSLMLLCVLLTGRIHGGSGAQDQPDSSPSSTEELRQIVRTIAGPLVNQGTVMGLSAAVICGDTSAIVSLGRVNKDSPATATSTTAYQIGSITKVFTCIALARLVQAGELKLDEPVQPLLPPGTDVPSSGTRRITVGDLATHTAGLPRVSTFFVEKLLFTSPQSLDNPYANTDPARMLRGLRTQRLASTPGAKWEYSNLGMGLLGYALTVKTGRKSYDAMLRELVLDPLGLADTGTTLSERQQNNTAQGYDRTNLLGMHVTWDESTTWTFTDAYAGAGALYSTPADMLRFMSLAMDPPPTAVGAAIRMTKLPRFEADTSITMGLGWLLLQRPQFEEPVYFHDGGTSGYSSFLAFHQPDHVGAVLLCNTHGEEVDRVGIKLLEALHARSRSQRRSLKP